MSVESKPAVDGSLPMIKRADFTEDHNFILEAAMQTGFEPNDDDATEYRVTDEWLITFAARVARSAIEQATGKALD